MGRLIDRQAAIETVRTAKSKGEAHRMLVQLPPAQPEITNEEIRFALKQLRVYFAIKIRDGKDGGVPVELLKLVEEIQEYFENMSPAQPGWIPWDSGRFPEESGTYTVTAYDGATKRVTYAKYQKRLKRWELTGARAYWRVLAWQPKPKPWEGEEK